MARPQSSTRCKQDPARGERGEITDLRHAYALFQEPWWLDAVAPGAWSEVAVEEDGTIVARLPFMIKRRFGVTALTQPPLTRVLGPWLAPSGGKYDAQLARQKELITELIAKLPPHDVLRMVAAPEVTNWLPFYWAGFVARPMYTYRIDDLTDENVLWSEVHTFARTAIRKAQRQVIVRTDRGIDAMLDVQERTYARHGWKMPARDLFYRVDEACAARFCRQSFVAEDAQGRLHASYYVVWDTRCAYAVGGGVDHELAKSGAGTLVRWEAVRFARSVTKAFDFVGSMSEPVERSFRRLGGRQVLSLHLSKTSRRMRVFSAGQELAAAVLGRRNQMT